MASVQYKNQKKPLQHSKNEIDRAARAIRHGMNGSERVHAVKVIQGFREYHLYPLMLMKNHLARTAASLGKNKVLVARRLKRLSTIVDKLERPTLDGTSTNAIKLTRMQDIAGCRAIVKNVSQLKKLQRKLQSSRSVHKIITIRDYMKPKDSGYGGVHIVYSCYENQIADHDWKKAKVEVQLRTELQHAWATSLEIIDTLEQTNLKTRHIGDDDWRKLFSIAGQLIAHEENAYSITDPMELLQLRKELKVVAEKLSVHKKLIDYALAIDFTTKKKISKKSHKGQGLFLVCMHEPIMIDNQPRLNVVVKYFPLSDSNRALSELNEADMNEKIIISVLVSASDVKALKQAYPNYFGSTTKFSAFLYGQIEKIE